MFMPQANPFIDFIAQYGIWIFGINLGLSFIGASMARKKGYSYGGFLCLGIFLSFLVNLTAAVCLTPKKNSERYHHKEKQNSELISCSNCGALCLQDMDYCPKCGNKLRNSCSNCGADYSDDMNFCSKCGAQLSDW
jgi:RNA polymerase subunit RPABC4/transcription elongation factor Spt4